VLVPKEQRRALDLGLRMLHLPGRRRIHMSNDGPPRRREIINTLVGLAIPGAVYIAPRPVASARPARLSAIADHALRQGANHLILGGRDDRQNNRDKSVLRDVLAKSETGCRHAPSREFPGLQAADIAADIAAGIVAWAYGAASGWCPWISPIIGHVRHLGP
jgi:hypothetical protein